MTAQAIHDAVVERDLYRFAADDPVHVVRTQLRRRCANLEFPSAVDDSRFLRFDGGRYGLAAWGNTHRELVPHHREPVDSTLNPARSSRDQLQTEYDVYLDHLTRRILRHVKELSPSDFETFGARLLQAYGLHDLAVTPASNDGGIDGTGKWELGTAQLDVAFQCKRLRTRAVSRPQVNEFRGSIAGKHQIGIYLTTSHFSKPAREESSRKGTFPIILIDGAEIVEIMLSTGFGVHSAGALPLYDLDLDTALAVDS